MRNYFQEINALQMKYYLGKIDAAHMEEYKRQIDALYQALGDAACAAQTKHAKQFGQIANQIITVFENRELVWIPQENLEEKNGEYPLAA